MHIDPDSYRELQKWLTGRTLFDDSLSYPPEELVLLVAHLLSGRDVEQGQTMYESEETGTRWSGHLLTGEALLAFDVSFPEPDYDGVWQQNNQGRDAPTPDVADLALYARRDILSAHAKFGRLVRNALRIDSQYGFGDLMLKMRGGTETTIVGSARLRSERGREESEKLHRAALESIG